MFIRFAYKSSRKGNQQWRFRGLAGQSLCKMETVYSVFLPVVCDKDLADPARKVSFHKQDLPFRVSKHLACDLTKGVLEPA